jgi:hypothetical protein
MYPNCVLATHPGTETKVNPESDAPIIPNATKYQGAFLFAEKKVALPLLFPTSFEMPNNTPK